MVGPSSQYESSGWLIRFRYRIAKLIYDAMFVILVRAGNWEEEIIESLAPKAGDRVFYLGPGGPYTAVSLAFRYPEAIFITLAPNSKTAGKVRSKVERSNIWNLSIVVGPPSGTLPFDPNSLDKAVCVLALHDASPAEKVGIVREIARIVRRDGALVVADFDKPESAGEGGMLEFARRISGSDAIAPHADGSWVDFLAKGGFARVRRQSSHSIGIGRITVVKARRY